MRLDWKVVGSAVACTLAIGYVACVAYDLLFGQEMYRVWMELLPGFHWISWGSFLLGLIEVIVYGVFFGLVFAPLYNFFLVKIGIQSVPAVVIDGKVADCAGRGPDEATLRAGGLGQSFGWKRIRSAGALALLRCQHWIGQTPRFRQGGPFCYDYTVMRAGQHRRVFFAVLALASILAAPLSVDLGCGTATLTVLLKQACPDADVVGLDGDPDVLKIARGRIEQTNAGIALSLYRGGKGAES